MPGPVPPQFLKSNRPQAAPGLPGMYPSAGPPAKKGAVPPQFLHRGKKKPPPKKKHGKFNPAMLAAIERRIAGSQKSRGVPSDPLPFARGGTHK